MYVITGGPCTGKTLLIKELERRGYPVVHETARALIKEQMKGGDLLPWIRLADFQLEVLARQSVKEAKAPANAFLDRGIPDGVAYCLEGRIAVPKTLEEKARQCAPRYTRVFILAPVRYRKDKVRMEDKEQAKRLQELIEFVYSQFGATIRDVPVMSVRDRARFVLAQCRMDMHAQA
jgi:predicted ATPase